MHTNARGSVPKSRSRLPGFVGLTAALLSIAGVANAQEVEVTDVVVTPRPAAAPARPREFIPAQDVAIDERMPSGPRNDPSARHFFLEATGGYGIQFGETDYLPSGSAGDWQHPLVHGYSFGGTAGLAVASGISLIANYEFSSSETRHGSIPGVLDDVIGSIEYHTVVAGARLAVPVAFGAVQAELGVGVALPFETQLRYSYGAGLGQLPTPITGEGTLRTEYSVGIGGHAMIGYQIPLGDVFYLATNLKARFFQSENSGEPTHLNNFVQDFGAVPPVATTGTIVPGDGSVPAHTEPVVDLRAQLAIGASF